MDTELIGAAGDILNILSLKAKRIRENPAISSLERRWLFHGPPGVGKSEVARALASKLAQQEHRIEFKIGSALGVEILRQWRQHFAYLPGIGEVTVKVVDELDTIPSQALTELRDLLDNLAPAHVIIGTTNKLNEKLPLPLQGRFQCWSFPQVPADSIALMLQSHLNLPAAVAKGIAQKASGDVRSALAAAYCHLDRVAAGVR